jgi:hypothetical protein
MAVAGLGVPMSEEPWTKELAIMQIVRQALAGVVEDTAVAAGVRHPLTERTREDIYYCLRLIEERERELAGSTGPSGACPESPPSPSGGEHDDST